MQRLEKQFQRVLALLLAAALVCQSTLSLSAMETEALPQTEEMTAQKESEPAQSGGLVIPEPIVYLNPDYEALLSEEEKEQALTAPVSRGGFYTSIPTFGSDEEAAAYMRSKLKLRQNQISMTLSWPEYNQDHVFELAYMALEHTGVGDEGDYISRQYKQFGCSMSYSTVTNADGSSYIIITLTYSWQYYSTLEQEKAVTDKLQQVYSDLHLDQLDTVHKISAIYNYICDNVAYDNDFPDKQAAGNMIPWTAYGGLILGTCVCQGYSELLYRMLLDNGIDSRILSGTADGGAHAWNIAQLENKYWLMDATWDTAWKEAPYASYMDFGYYLRGTGDFDDHAASSEYLDASWTEKYPVPTSKYCTNHNSGSNGTFAWSFSLFEEGKAEYTCTKCAQPWFGPITVSGYTNTVTMQPDCETEGVRTQSAQVKAQLKGTGATASSKTLTQTTAIPALGHQYTSSPKFVWSADGLSAQALFTCASNTSHTLTLQAQVSEVSSQSTAATCETAGVRATQAVVSLDGKNYSSAVQKTTIPALGHTWQFSKFVWNSDYTSAKARLVCATDASHVREEDAQMETERVPSTCVSNGSLYSTAKYTLNGKTYTETKQEILPLSGHNWTAQFTFASDGSSVTGRLVCQNDPSHVETLNPVLAIFAESVPATCESSGVKVVQASATYDGVLYESEKQSFVLAPLGHDWADPVFVWSDDNVSAAASRVCRNDASHVQQAAMEMRFSQTEPTCTQDGSWTVKATARFDENSVAYDSKTTVLPALGHDLVTEFVWGEDGKASSMHVTCSKCDLDESVSVTNALQPDSTQADCEHAGSLTYVATAVYDNVTYTSEPHTIQTAALGHDWKLSQVNWNEDHSQAEFEFVCANDASHTEKVSTQKIERAVESAACENNGKERWSATIVFDGKEWSASDEYILKATGHDLSGEFVWGSDGKATGLKVTCSRCDLDETVSVSNTLVNSVEASCVSTGLKTYTAKGSWNGVEFVSDPHTITLPALGHDWTLSQVNWNEDHTTAEFEFVCANDASHTEKVSTQRIDRAVEPAACENNGKERWSATAVFDGKEWSASDVFVIEATGHDLSGEFVWGSDGKATALKVTCSRCDLNETVSVTNTLQNTVEAGCESDGSKTWIAKGSWNGVEFVSEPHTVTVPAAGHDWKLGQVRWNEDHTLAVFEFVCSNDASHTEEAATKRIDHAAEPASCTANGKERWTATAFFEGKDWTASDEAVLEATGHDISGEFVWGEDGKATGLHITCSRCDLSETVSVTNTLENSVKAGCESDGLKTYTAKGSWNKVEFVSEPHTVTVPALGHDWKLGDVQWTEDHKQAVFAFVCAHDASHSEEVATQRIDRAAELATCESNGKERWTATAFFDGKDWTASDVTVVKATGHDWGQPQAAWSGSVKEGTLRCTLTWTCVHDSSHTEIRSNLVPEIDESAKDCTHAYTVLASVVFEEGDLKGSAKYSEQMEPCGHDLDEDMICRLCKQQGKTVYRLYQPKTGEHLYTIDRNEYDWLPNANWVQEGTAWVAPEASDSPVYRVYNPNSHDHHYTTDENEAKWLSTHGWNDEGIAWYSAKEDGSKVLRLFNSHIKGPGTHLFTLDQNEYDWLPTVGWTQEGPAWYSWKLAE